MSKVEITSQRQRLWCWAGEFLLINFLFLGVIALSYLSSLPHFSDMPLVDARGEWVAVIFGVLAFVGQLGLLTALVGLPLGLLIFFNPRPRLIIPSAVVLAGLGVCLFAIDAVVFHFYRLHLLGFTWELVNSGVFHELIMFSWLEQLLLVVGFLGLFILESVLAYGLWQRVKKLEKHSLNGRRFRYIFFTIFSALWISYTVYMKAAFTTLACDARSKSNGHFLVMVAQVVPYYNEFLAALLPLKNAYRLLSQAHDTFYVQNRGLEKPLRYPHQILKFFRPSRPMNIVIIGIDTWRFDMLRADVTPNLFQFSQKSLYFTNHFSGGNSTLPGIFSLFYSLPVTYWSAVLAQHRAPVFFDRLRTLDYQIYILMSASMRYPPFAQTVFNGVSKLRIETPGRYAYGRDKRITDDFLRFLETRKKQKPFFSFLFYDAVHNWCSGPQPYRKPFQPALKNCNRLVLGKDTDTRPFRNRYQNALHYVDALIGRVLARLRQDHLLKNTLVLVTADHGEEFNDTKQGYWWHASAYDPYQIRVPLLISWPGRAPQRIDYRTSHYDIVPTLMQSVLGGQSPIADYSVGHLLFRQGHRPYLIVSNYRGYAIVTPQRITTFYPGGAYRITDAFENPLVGARIEAKQLRHALHQTTRFFH